MLVFGAAPVVASEERPTIEELENEVMCPTCNTTLALSESSVADQIRRYIEARIAAGDTKSEIKDQLVAEFGEAVLAAPPRRGFSLIAWVLPFVGLALAGVVIGVLVRRWARAGGRLRGRGPEAPELDTVSSQRLDEELARFD
jgi:cytochrome c-type biogenesis protein CcmH